MNLASRIVPPTTGNSHNQTVVPTTNAHVISNNAGRRGNNALMSLFNSGVSVPRQITVQARGAQDNVNVPINLNFIGTIGHGTFGQIERATLTVHPDSKIDPNAAKTPDNSSSSVAVKRVLQDPRFKNRELGIMQRINNHPNIVKFYYYYYSTSPSSSRSHRTSSARSGSTPNVDLFLHLILECFPENLCELIYRFVHQNNKLPLHMIEVFTYQMLKALAYLHSHQICHRDIKSSNLLVDANSLVLKVCDFGSAKEMVPGVANVSYISSRYYRAPELLFGAQFYSCAIDTWSGGCVLAEMLGQKCLFTGIDSVDQLVKIIRVLGTPSTDDIASMNPMYGSYNFPDVHPCPIKLFFPHHTSNAMLTMLSKMLIYNPMLRISPLDALSDSCFDGLREVYSQNHHLPTRVNLPSNLFDPNPAPTPAVNKLSETGSGQTDSNNGQQSTDLRNWHNKKLVDFNGVPEKKCSGSKPAREPMDDLSKKGRRQGPGSNSEKLASGITSNPILSPNQISLDFAADVPKTGNARSMSSKSNSSRRTLTNSNGSKKSNDKDLDQSDSGSSNTVGITDPQFSVLSQHTALVSEDSSTRALHSSDSINAR